MPLKKSDYLSLSICVLLNCANKASPSGIFPLEILASGEFKNCLTSHCCMKNKMHRGEKIIWRQGTRSELRVGIDG